MTKWEYCCLEWNPNGASVYLYGKGSNGLAVQTHALNEFGNLFARLGLEGWELVSSLTNPTGSQEYWYYFKRPVS